MKSRTAQLIFQSMYAALALVACVGSVGFYDMKFTSDFYIYFTNISNYLSFHAGGPSLEENFNVRRNQKDAS